MTLTNVILTAYCACQVCTGNGKGLAADGRRVAAGAIAAPRHIPFGGQVSIPGVGCYTVRDRTARRFDGRWDIYMKTHREAKKFGIRTATVRLTL